MSRSLATQLFLTPSGVPLEQGQGAWVLVQAARHAGGRRVPHARVQVVHEAGPAVHAVLRLRWEVREPAQRVCPSGSKISSRAK